jgi:hypothetical protein
MSKSSVRREAPKPVERKPQCVNKKRDGKGKHYRCTNDGVACWVTGEFGRMPMCLCNPCIMILRGIGWKVRYQIEGDNPPPLPNELMGDAK